MEKRTFLKAVALPFALQATQSLAQGTSGRAIRVVVPLPAGTFIDFVARGILAHASKVLGQPIVVENKPGANGITGAMEVVRATPDGLTLLCATNSHLATNVALVKNLPSDPRRDLTPIAGAIEGTQVIMVKASSPIRTFSEFIAFAKRNPGKLSVGYSTSIIKLELATLSKMDWNRALAGALQRHPGCCQRRDRRRPGCDAGEHWSSDRQGEGRTDARTGSHVETQPALSGLPCGFRDAARFRLSHLECIRRPGRYA